MQHHAHYTENYCLHLRATNIFKMLIEMISFHAESFLVSFYEVVLVDISPSFRDIFIFLIISFPAKNSEFSHLRAISPLAIHLCDLHLQNIAHLPHTPLQLRQKLMCVSKSL